MPAAHRGHDNVPGAAVAVRGHPQGARASALSDGLAEGASGVTLNVLADPYNKVSLQT